MFSWLGSMDSMELERQLLPELCMMKLLVNLRVVVISQMLERYPKRMVYISY